MSVIRKRGDYQYQSIVRKKGYPPQSKTFISLREAQIWAANTESEMHRSVWVSRATAEATTLRELIERYVNEVTPRHKGAESEQLRLAMLARSALGDRFVATLRPSDFSSYRVARLKIRKPATVVRELNLFSSVLSMAIKEWDINIVNPLTNVERPTARNERKRSLSQEEEDRLLAELDPRTRNELGILEPGGTLCHWARPIVQLAIETAMRRSEILALKWPYVHLDRRFVELHHTKNGYSREVPLSRKAVSVLESLPRSPDGRVFPVTVAAFKKVYERAVVRAEIRDLTFHDLRRVGTAKLSKKLSVLDLAATTGHRQINVLFQRYYSVSGEELAAKLG